MKPVWTISAGWNGCIPTMWLCCRRLSLPARAGECPRSGSSTASCITTVITFDWKSGPGAMFTVRCWGGVRLLESQPVAEERHGTDPLTGLESRSHFEQLLDERLATESGSFSLLQFTVDHSAKIQQLFGEAACDAMLAKLARMVRMVRHELRREDPFARWDQDGFILMLSQTDRLSGLEIAERLRLEIADASLLPQRPVTVSVGLVQSQAGEHIDHLLARLATCHGQARREHNAVVG